MLQRALSKIKSIGSKLKNYLRSKTSNVIKFLGISDIDINTNNNIKFD